MRVDIDIERVPQIHQSVSSYYSYDSYRNSYFGDYIYVDNVSYIWDNLKRTKFVKLEQDRLIFDEDYTKLNLKHMPGFLLSWHYSIQRETKIVPEKIDRIKHKAFKRLTFQMQSISRSENVFLSVC